jgi:hypothetical protein
MMPLQLQHHVSLKNNFTGICNGMFATSLTNKAFRRLQGGAFSTAVLLLGERTRRWVPLNDRNKTEYFLFVDFQSVSRADTVDMNSPSVADRLYLPTHLIFHRHS